VLNGSGGTAVVNNIGGYLGVVGNGPGAGGRVLRLALLSAVIEKTNTGEQENRYMFIVGGMSIYETRP
jgi:hypothetical protein